MAARLPALLLRAVDEGCQGVAAEVGVDGHGVDLEGGLGTEVGVGEGRRGGAYVAALGVEDHQEPEVAGAADDRLEGAEPGPAEALEEGDLRLDDRHPAAQALEDRAEERLDRGRGLRVPGVHRAAAEERRNAVEVGIEADAQRVAEPAQTEDQAVGEVFHVNSAPGR